MPLHGEINLANRDRQRHVVRLTCLQAAGDRLADILQRLGFSSALRYASRYGWAFRYHHACLIQFQRYEKLHVWMLANVNLRCNIHLQSYGPLPGLPPQSKYPHERRIFNRDGGLVVRLGSDREPIMQYSVDKVPHMEIIQVVIDAKLLKAADLAAKRQHLNRSALIRQALQQHLRRLNVLELEERDRCGYQARPQQPEEFRPWEDSAAWPEP